jgi:hypothetical protein
MSFRHIWLVSLSGDKKAFKFLDSHSDEVHANFFRMAAMSPTARTNRADSRCTCGRFRDPTENGRSRPTAVMSRVGGEMDVKSTISLKIAN